MPLTVLAGLLVVGALLVYAARETTSSASAVPAPAGGAE